MLSYLKVIKIQINTSNQDFTPDELLWEAQPQVLQCSSSIGQLATDS